MFFSSHWYSIFFYFKIFQGWNTNQLLQEIILNFAPCQFQFFYFVSMQECKYSDNISSELYVQLLTSRNLYISVDSFTVYILSSLMSHLTLYPWTYRRQQIFSKFQKLCSLFGQQWIISSLVILRCCIFWSSTDTCLNRMIWIRIIAYRNYYQNFCYMCIVLLQQVAPHSLTSILAFD